MTKIKEAATATVVAQEEEAAAVEVVVSVAGARERSGKGAVKER